MPIRGQPFRGGGRGGNGGGMGMRGGGPPPNMRGGRGGPPRRSASDSRGEFLYSRSWANKLCQLSLSKLMYLNQALKKPWNF